MLVTPYLIQSKVPIQDESYHKESALPCPCPQNVVPSSQGWVITCLQTGFALHQEDSSFQWLLHLKRYKHSSDTKTSSDHDTGWCYKIQILHPEPSGQTFPLMDCFAATDMIERSLLICVILNNSEFERKQPIYDREAFQLQPELLHPCMYCVPVCCAYVTVF